MKQIKVSEATGPALDGLVAVALGANWVKTPESQSWMLHWPSPLFGDQPRWSVCAPDYSTNWYHGGQIVENALLAPDPMLDDNCQLIQWRCCNWKGDGSDYYGPTYLIAAMRCFVASKLGDTVKVPEKLL